MAKRKSILDMAIGVVARAGAASRQAPSISEVVSASQDKARKLAEQLAAEAAAGAQRLGDSLRPDTSQGPSAASPDRPASAIDLAQNAIAQEARLAYYRARKRFNAVGDGLNAIPGRTLSLFARLQTTAASIVRAGQDLWGGLDERLVRSRADLYRLQDLAKARNASEIRSLVEARKLLERLRVRGLRYAAAMADPFHRLEQQDLAIRNDWLDRLIAEAFGPNTDADPANEVVAFIGHCQAIRENGAEVIADQIGELKTLAESARAAAIGTTSFEALSDLVRSVSLFEEALSTSKEAPKEDISESDIEALQALITQAQETVANAPADEKALAVRSFELTCQLDELARVAGAYSDLRTRYIDTFGKTGRIKSNIFAFQTAYAKVEELIKSVQPLDAVSALCNLELAVKSEMDAFVEANEGFNEKLSKRDDLEAQFAERLDWAVGVWGKDNLLSTWTPPRRPYRDFTLRVNSRGC
jgi:hypothetical protein